MQNLNLEQQINIIMYELPQQKLSEKNKSLLLGNKELLLKVIKLNLNVVNYLEDSKILNDIDVIITMLEAETLKNESMPKNIFFKEIIKYVKNPNHKISFKLKRNMSFYPEILLKSRYNNLHKLYPNLLKEVKEQLLIDRRMETTKNSFNMTEEEIDDLVNLFKASKLSSTNFIKQNEIASKLTNLQTFLESYSPKKENLYIMQEEEKRKKLILVANKIVNNQLTIKQYCDNEATTYPLSYLLHYIEEDSILRAKVIQKIYEAKLNNEIDTKDIIKLLTRRKANLDFKYNYDINNVKTEILNFRKSFQLIGESSKNFDIFKSTINTLELYLKTYNREESINEKHVYQKYDKQTNNIIRINILEHHYDEAFNNLNENNSIICKKTVTDEALRIAINEFVKDIKQKEMK